MEGNKDYREVKELRDKAISLDCQINSLKKERNETIEKLCSISKYYWFVNKHNELVGKYFKLSSEFIPYDSYIYITSTDIISSPDEDCDYLVVNYVKFTVSKFDENYITIDKKQNKIFMDSGNEYIENDFMDGYDEVSEIEAKAFLKEKMNHINKSFNIE
jgi:hypothetical protein